jgi:TRAP-type mannitol/chloroaromatic compound transport system permease small subunit
VAHRIDGLNESVGRGLHWLLAAMILIGAFNAVARYLGHVTPVRLSSNAWIELQWYLFSLVFLLGAGYALRHDAHVRVDVIYARFGPKGRAWIDLLGTLLFLLPFCVLMLLVSWPAVHASWSVREGSPDPGGLPRWPIKASILLAFVLLFLQGVSQAIKQVAILRGAPVRAVPAHHRPEEV